MLIKLSPQFRKDLKTLRKKKQSRELGQIWELIIEIQTYWERPLEGKGQPEALKHLGGDIYSRRISSKHRLIYRLKENHLELISCWGHYTSL